MANLGSFSARALGNAGDVVGWGDFFGSTRFSPYLAPEISSVASVRTTGGCTVALKTDGTTWFAGYCPSLNSATNTSPNGYWTQINDFTDIKDVAIGRTASDNFILILRSDGKVYAWGGNRHGELGRGTYGFVDNDLAEVQGLPGGIVKIAAGELAGGAIGGSGNAYTWGY